MAGRVVVVVGGRWRGGALGVILIWCRYNYQELKSVGVVSWGGGGGGRGRGCISYIDTMQSDQCRSNVSCSEYYHLL